MGGLVQVITSIQRYAWQHEYERDPFPLLKMSIILRTKIEKHQLENFSNFSAPVKNRCFIPAREHSIGCHFAFTQS